MKMLKMTMTIGALLGLISCSHQSSSQRYVASETPKGNETGNRMEEVIEGIIKQAECNRPTGLGTIELEVKRGKTIETTWYKVNSEELCSREVESGFFLGKATVLTDLSAKNVTEQDATISSLKIVDGFVVSVEPVRKVNYPAYMKSVDRYDSIGNNREVFDWYFQNRRSR